MTPTTPDAQVTGRRRRPLYKDLSLQILAAMLLGSLVGYLWPQSAESLRPLGDLFIRLVRMIVAPIIFCTVVHGIASVGEARRVGRVAVKALCGPFLFAGRRLSRYAPCMSRTGRPVFASTQARSS